MRFPGKIVGIIGILLLVVIVLMVSGGFLFIQRTFPEATSGLKLGGLTLAPGTATLRLPGLSAPVEVLRDAQGVPHIYAQSMPDLFLAQGYVTAQDRLWQLEFNRRAGSGRLSEILGAPTLNTDIYMRTLGLRRAAEADVARLDPSIRSYLEAYASGVNAFIASHKDRLPLEFLILGFQPEPWTPTDSLTWGKVMALSLSGNMGTEVLRYQLSARLGPERLTELEPGYPATGPFIVEQLPPNLMGPKSTLDQPHLEGLFAFDPAPLAQLAAQDEQVRRLILGTTSDAGLGSNNWVVDGSKSATGKPLLANDPHLSIQLPSIWVQVHLVAPGYNVVGVTFPGVPGVVIGHNDRIAWGVTNVGPDVQDLFIEKFNPANPKQVEYKGQWENLQVIQETIKVKGQAEPVVKEILISRHGPIVAEVVSGAPAGVALSWTALQPGTLYQSLLAINQARNWHEFRAALRYWDVPSQNFVYADVDGNIGYQMPGRIPIRAKGNGTLPVPGWTGEYDWIGEVPFDELPSIFNPPSHYVVTANNQVPPPGYKYFLTNDWAAPYRAQRIVDRIKAKERLTVADMADIQADAYSIPTKAVAAAMAEATAANATQQKMQALVAAWDGVLSEESTAGMIAEAFTLAMLRNTFSDELGNLTNSYLSRGMPVLIRLLATPGSPWFDDTSTPTTETLREIATRSLADVEKDLTARFGNDPSRWRWGEAHLAVFNHTLGAVQPLDRLFNRQTPVRGGPFAVFAASYSLGRPYTVGAIPSFRQVVDLSNLNASRIQNTLGQSGLVFHPHYDDQLQNWRTATLYPMRYDRADVERELEARLTLTP